MPRIQLKRIRAKFTDEDYQALFQKIEDITEGKGFCVFTIEYDLGDFVLRLSGGLYRKFIQSGDGYFNPREVTDHIESLEITCYQCIDEDGCPVMTDFDPNRISINNNN